MRIITKTNIHTMIGLLILLSIFLAPASAISADDANVGTTLIVSDIPAGADVFFILNNGIPVFARADSNGTARYLPLVEGNLIIDVMQNGNLIDTMTVIVGPEITPTPTSSPSSGGGTGGRGTGTGTGGSGVISREPFNNVAQYETEENNLIAGKSVTYSFTNPGIVIYQLVVTGTQNEDKVAIRVESLNGTSKLAGGPAPGNVYANTNIWSGSNNINSILVKFKVENSWISEIESSNINLVEWNQNKWISLETKETRKDDKYTYFEANTTRLNIFAISAGIEASAPIEEETPVIIPRTTPEILKTTTEPTPAKTTKTPGFEIALAIVGISVIFIGIKKNKINQKNKEK